MIQKHRQENISVQGGERKQVSERRSLKDIVPRAVNTLWPALSHSVKQWRWSPPTCHTTSSVPVKGRQRTHSCLGLQLSLVPTVGSVHSTIVHCPLVHSSGSAVHPSTHLSPGPGPALSCLCLGST